MPHRYGGGAAFGPKPRRYTFKINRKARRRALRAALTVHAELHQLPIFVRVGSGIDLGDLNQQFAESTDVASKRPDLQALEAEVKSWFEKVKR